MKENNWIIRNSKLCVIWTK